MFLNNRQNKGPFGSRKLGLWIWKLWNDFTLPRKQITCGCLVDILKNMKVKHINDSNAPFYCNIPKKPLIKKRNPTTTPLFVLWSLLVFSFKPKKKRVSSKQEPCWGPRWPAGEWKTETWGLSCGRRSLGGLQVWGSNFSFLVVKK